MYISKHIYAAVAFLTLVIVSCSSSDPSAPPETPGSQLICRGTSIADGATVDAYQTHALTVSYNNLVSVTSAGGITVNGKTASATADGMNINVTLSLEPATEYTVKIAAGAVAMASDTKITNEDFTLTFNTGRATDATSVAKRPVNLNATAETVSLYNSLLAGYGKQMLSGAMGGVAWETSYTDFIKENTGAYPAVVGFDYIHLAWSPANWIDYGNITPVKSVHDRGCVVEIQWHWNVPASENSSDISSSSDKTTFNPANILVEGTWENKIAIADVDKLAGYLKLLQDAKIPVLWRPFHEAAGDYKWGAWFWWGSKGTDVTKRLWIWLYDKLTNQYKLNNLIWVWTVCTSDEGKPASLSKMVAAYPGDEYVDIVGADLYPDQTLTDQSAQFALVSSVVDGRKMVALTECGNLVSPEAAYTANALWSYFMQWYDLKDGKPAFNNYKGPEQWRQVLASPYVKSIK